ncbi:hypothetical protein FSP39_023800 [Pinctada imbricata]|uniref:G-protein coupled receptors family 1 profile domain-containing protein n=1 Tax=Pinctada imbricata TaxID=66713 RepID=A0AA88YBL6_PINIB|nr:hypothetical protein FSP39_023800 [Pinctada imbricata]
MGALQDGAMRRELHLNNESYLSDGIVRNSSYLEGTSTALGRTPVTSSNSPPLPQDAFNTFMNGYIAIAVITLGLVGNSLTIIVLTRRTMHSSTNCYLLALAIWDAFVLIGTLFLITLPEVSESFRDIVQPYIIVYVYPFALTAHMATLWLTVSFTVERYIAVCHPLKAARMCTIARARIVIICVSVVSFMYNLTRWFEYEIHQTYSNITNSTIVRPRKTYLSKSEIYREVYFFWLYLFIMFFIPLTSLAILNSFLILAVKKSQQQRKDMNVRQSRENNVTIMLVSVVIVFMICQVPALIYNTAWAIDNKIVTTRYEWEVLSTVRNFMVTLNSCVNFILYCAFGQKFRRTFVRTFCVCFLDVNELNSFTYPHTTVLASSAMNYGKYHVIRGKKGLHFKMTDISGGTNVTRTSLLSKYSPQSVKNSPRSSVKSTQKPLYENGLLLKKNGIKVKECDTGNEEDHEMCRMLKKDDRSCPPSPI